MSRALCAFCLVTALCPQHARGQWHVWTTTLTRHVLRGDPPGAALEVSLAGARNEWVAFQILLRADSPVEGVNLEAGDLAGPEGASLPAADTRLYRQHQIELTAGTVRNDDFRPDGYPDPLIPFNHPLTGGKLPAARLRAVPFDLPAGQTHGFWVDVYIPPTAQAGAYCGTYRLTGEGQKPVAIPVRLTVWDFRLPDTPTMRTAFGSPAKRMRPYYRRRAKAGKEAEPADWNAVEAQCADLLARHRINATPPSKLTRPVPRVDGTYVISPANVDELRRFVDRYHVNAVKVPNPAKIFADPRKDRAKLLAWLRSVDRAADTLNRPEVTFYIYLRDEPNDAKAYSFVRNWGKAIRQAHSAVKVMVTEQTTPQNPDWGNLYGAVDIWCHLFPLFDPAAAAKRQALGEAFWAYTCLCLRNRTPWWHIDSPLLNYRVPAWIAWRFDTRGLLYWGGMCYWKEVEDPWTDGWTYGHKNGKNGLVYNGEGTLAYPARPVGYDGIVPSLRLKGLRAGIQDYEYMAILDRLGVGAEARKIVEPLAESWFKWDPDPAAYEKARERLAALIVDAQRGQDPSVERTPRGVITLRASPAQ